MRCHILSLAILVGLGTAAQAEQSRTGTVVDIAPRYLSAGTAVSSYEYRGEAPYADARFRSATYAISGRFEDPNRSDPWAAPVANRTYNVDWNFLNRGARRNY